MIPCKDYRDAPSMDGAQAVVTPEVSICMCSYSRASLLRKTLESIRRQGFPSLEIIVCEDGDDGGWTRGVCEEFGVLYFQRKSRPDQPYSNPAIPWNVALRQATGDVIILQNPECVHVGDNVIERLAAPHRADPKVAVFASVMALNPDGSPSQWYCHPQHSARPFFFCGSLRRETVFALRGFDEDFGRGTAGYGYDDDNFAFRLQMFGVQFRFSPESEILVHHNWHPGTDCFGLQSNEALFHKKLEQLIRGEVGMAANSEREWGTDDG